MLRSAWVMMANSLSPLARRVWMKSWLRISLSDERVVRVMMASGGKASAMMGMMANLKSFQSR